MTFDGTEYTVDGGVVKHRVSGGWISENNLPSGQHGGARGLDTSGGYLIVTCGDGTKYAKKPGCGWSKK